MISLRSVLRYVCIENSHFGMAQHIAFTNFSDNYRNLYFNACAFGGTQSQASNLMSSGKHSKYGSFLADTKYIIVNPPAPLRKGGRLTVDSLTVVNLTADYLTVEEFL